jgi:hypothetical protein
MNSSTHLLTQTLKNRCTYLAAAVLTLAAFYLLVAPPI